MFPRAALMDYTLCGLKQQKGVLSQFWKLEALNEGFWQSHGLFEVSREAFVDPSSFQISVDSWHLLACRCVIPLLLYGITHVCCVSVSKFLPFIWFQLDMTQIFKPVHVPPEIQILMLI